MNVAERFKRVRKEIAKKNQKEMAELLGVSEITIRRYETGKTEIPKVVALALEALYGINHHWLLTGEGSMFVTSPHKEPSKETPTNQAGIDRELAQMLSMLSPEQQKVLSDIFKEFLKKGGEKQLDSSLEKQKERGNLTLNDSHRENVVK